MELGSRLREHGGLGHCQYSCHYVWLIWRCSAYPAGLPRGVRLPASAGQPHKALNCAGKAGGPCHSPDACAAGVSVTLRAFLRSGATADVTTTRLSGCGRAGFVVSKLSVPRAAAGTLAVQGEPAYRCRHGCTSQTDWRSCFEGRSAIGEGFVFETDLNLMAKTCNVVQLAHAGERKAQARASGGICPRSAVGPAGRFARRPASAEMGREARGRGPRSQ